MRVLACLEKTFLENLREWKILVLTLGFAPFFVLLMSGYMGAATPAYNLLVFSRDSSEGVPDATRALVDEWMAARHPDGRAVFHVTAVLDSGAARAALLRRDADLLVEIPADFSRRLAAFRAGGSRPPARMVNVADAGNVRGSMAMAYSDYLAYAYTTRAAGITLPLDVLVRPAGSGRPLDDFDLYVPALLVLALIMVLFTAAASLVKEVDQGTMVRLQLSKLTTTELLAAVSVNQVLIGLVALGLAYAAALACGYRSQGSLGALLVVGAATTLGVVAIGVLTAAFLKSMFELLTVGVFPFFVLMFFSECMFPLPRIRMAQLLGHTLYLNDLLPTTLCVHAFGRILNFGAGVADVGFELGAILCLTALYFSLGAWLFRRRHQRI